MIQFVNGVKNRLRSVRARWLSGEARSRKSKFGEQKVPASGFLFDSLKGRARGKLRAVASILKCSETEAAITVFDRMLAAMPNHSHASYLLPHLSVNRCERINEELVQIEIENGRIFTGQRSNKKEYLLHQLFSKHIPESIIGDAYKLALDIERRYFGTHLPWYCVKGGTYIEGGCFTGIKAMHWHDSPRKPKRILAVEMGRTNFEILRSNISDNGLAEKIIPIHAGLWSESGEGVQKHSFSTRRFLSVTDRWENQMQHEEPVRLITLPDLMDEYRIETADFLNLQVNGAEIEVLKGLRGAFDRIKVLSVAAYYSQDEVKNADTVEDMLSANGCTILERDGPGRITAVTAKFRNEILALKGRQSTPSAK
jgi:FkbM family methyltransferase